MVKANILVVEDEINLLEGIRTVLELDGYTVHTADNGETALQVLRQSVHLPDLIVSDIMMPRMDGIQLLKEVRKETAWVGVPFIFLTARSEKTDVQRGKQLGVDDYLIKPFEADDLLIAVESRLNRHRALTQAHQDQMSDLKRRILTILNHEFRTPLTFVVAYADLLNEQTGQNISNEDMLTFLRGINTGAVRLRRLIENFILLVEFETGDARAAYDLRAMTIHNIHVVLQKAVDAVFGAINTHTCEVFVEEGLPKFTADPEYLAMAVIQLLDNAVKFSPQGSTITLDVRQHEGEILLSVIDPGRGIPPAELEHIWESFYQVNRAVHEDPGAGSGLAIVRGIVNLHGGRVDVESALGEGSRFTIILPVR